MGSGEYVRGKADDGAGRLKSLPRLAHPVVLTPFPTEVIRPAALTMGPLAIRAKDLLPLGSLAILQQKAPTD